MSPIRLGEAFRRPVAPPEPEIEVSPSDDFGRFLELLEGLSRPTVLVEPPDLSAIVTAVTSLRPGVTAAEIAAALQDVIQPAREHDTVEPLNLVASKLEALDFRLKGMGVQAYGGGSATLAPGSSIGVNNFPASIRTPAAADILHGYDNRTIGVGATTIITVPAGRTFIGKVAASVSCTVAAAVNTSAETVATFSVSGAGATPAAGNLFTVAAQAGANAVTGVSGTEGNNYGELSVVVVAPAENSVAIQYAITMTGSTSQRAAVVAHGALD